MAFDAIETTVANALLLKAQMGESEPIILKTKPFAELNAYTERVLAELTLSSLLQEPLGKHCFNRFLSKNKKDALLNICTDIRLIRGASGKSKRNRGLKIVNCLSEEGGVPVALNPAAITVRVNHADSDPASESTKSNQPPIHEKLSVSASPPLNRLAQPQDSINAASGSADHMRARQIKGDQEKTYSNKEGSHPHHNQLSLEESEDDTQDHKAGHLQSSLDMKTEVEDLSKRPSVKPNPIDIEKSIERIKIDHQIVNENSKSPLSVSKESNFSEGMVVPNKPVVGWNPIFTKDIPDYALEMLASAVHNPELFESDRMMEVFELIYGVLYNELNQQWFPKFLKSGEAFEIYVCHSEYAETSKVGFDNFQMFRALGKGAFGMVSAVQKKDTKKVYAMKAMSKRKIKHYHSEKLCEIEKAALQKVDSPFILNLKYAFTNEKNIFLVLALCNGGDLQYHLTEVRGHRFLESRAQFYAAEVILALEHLHKKKFVYRDLKPGNILIDSDGHIVLSDLGLVHRISSKRPLRTLAGTSGYWAPEVMKRQVYDYTADWWSFGIFLHKLLSGRRPRCDCKKPKQWCPFGTKKEHAEMAKVNEPMTFDLVLDDLTFSKNAQDLLKKLLEPDPAKRLGANGADEVKRHPFFADISWMELAEKQVEPPFKPTRNDINAVSLGEISSEGDRKFKKVVMDEKDDKFYEKWDYVSVKTIQEEIVAAFEHNLELEKRPPKKPPVKENNTQCCIIL